MTLVDSCDGALVSGGIPVGTGGAGDLKDFGFGEILGFTGSVDGVGLSGAWDGRVGERLLV